MIPVGGYPGGYDAKKVSDETSVHTGSETLVQQHQGEEADINVIIRRYGVTKAMPSGPGGGVYGDFTGIDDYESALAAVERAERGFMALPPDVRERFQNDPGEYLAHVDSLEDSELGPEVGLPAPVVENPASEGSGAVPAT